MKKNSFVNLLVLLSIIFISACSKDNTARLLTAEPEVDTVQSVTPSPTIPPTPTATPTPLPEVRLQSGDRAFFNGTYEIASDEYQKAIDNTSDQNIIAGSRLGLARIEYEQGNYINALEIIEGIIPDTQLSPKLIARVNFFAGLCYEQLNRFEEAASSYLTFIANDPGPLNAFMYIKAGDAYTSALNYSEAIQAYQNAIDSATPDEVINAKIKLGNIYFAQEDYTNAVRIYLEVHDESINEYTRAQMNLLAGQGYLALGLPEQAYARFQESVLNYPRAFDTYSGLVALVEAGIPVDEFYRGLVDYYAGRYGLAIDAFNRYLNANPDHNGSAHYYKALSLRAIDDTTAAIAEWQVLIQDHPDDRFFVDSWEDIAYTQWAYQGNYKIAIETLLSFVRLYPTHAQAPQILYDAARIMERDDQLTKAAQTWGRFIDEYPQAEISSQAQFLSGITYYRIGDFENALNQFQRFLLLSGIPNDTAAGNFWIGKCYEAQGNVDQARQSWTQASLADPTGYYSERAKELLEGASVFTPQTNTNYAINYDQERMIAELWMIQTFQLPDNTNFIAIEPLLADDNFRMGKAFWDIGLFQEARNQFEIAREIFKNDPLALFRMTHYFVDIGLYRSAIYTSRQILDLANLDGIATFEAPLWFNHTRFGLYFDELVLESAEEYNFDPLLLFSLIRQESFFEGFIESAAGARGLMQIMPATGDEIAASFNWPPDYSSEDLYNPYINIRLGTRYLSRLRDYFGGDLYAALAAYNAGPGNVLNWEDQAHNDPDLFLELIPYEETRRYLRNIFEFYRIYQDLYKTRGQ